MLQLDFNFNLLPGFSMHVSNEKIETAKQLNLTSQISGVNKTLRLSSTVRRWTHTSLAWKITSSLKFQILISSAITATSCHRLVHSFTYTCGNFCSDKSRLKEKAIKENILLSLWRKKKHISHRVYRLHARKKCNQKWYPSM